MMSPAPGPWGNQRYQFEMPPLSDFDGAGPPTLDVAAEGGDGDAVADLSVYTQGRRFIDLFNTGKGEIEWKATASQPWVKLDRTRRPLHHRAAPVGERGLGPLRRTGRDLEGGHRD